MSDNGLKALKEPKNESIDDQIKKFRPTLRKILNYRWKTSEGLNLSQLSQRLNLRYETVRNAIWLEKKKDNDFNALLIQIEQELVLDRKIVLDNKFYKMICEEDDHEQVRKSTKTFYELNKLIAPENKPVVQTVIAINIPISLKDVKPADIDN